MLPSAPGPDRLTLPAAADAQAGRYRLARGKLGVTLAVNLALFGLKLAAGLAGASRALVVDAWHSLSDAASTLVAWSGLRLASRPRDIRHPWGHGKFETISVAGLAAFLSAAGFLFLWRGVAGLAGYARGEPVTVPGVFPLYAAAVSCLVKEALYRYAARAGRMIGSRALVADAWHHRSDALSSLPALVGVWASRRGYPFMDPAAAVLISLLVIGAGVRLGREAFHELVEGSLEGGEIARIRAEIMSVEGVLEVHDLRGRCLGSQVMVETHLIVDGDISVQEGHRIADAVEHRLKRKFPAVCQVISHVDPVGRLT